MHTGSPPAPVCERLAPNRLRQSVRIARTYRRYLHPFQHLSLTRRLRFALHVSQRQNRHNRKSVCKFAGAEAQGAMYQARFAAHSRSNSDVNRISFGSGSTGGGGCDGGTRRTPPGSFRDVDATFRDSPRAAHRKFEADQDRGNQESSRAARGQERLAEGVAERLAEELGAGDHRPNEYGCGRSRVSGDVSDLGACAGGCLVMGPVAFFLQTRTSQTVQVEG